jgi:amino acid adenylation domain-containing protein
MGTLVERVNQMARQYPSNTAVAAMDGSLTYAQLIGQARRIASSIQDRGLGSGDVIAVSVARDRMLPAALLGILEAGAAYLPVDRGWPRARIEPMLVEAGVKLVVSDDYGGPDSGLDIPVLRLSDIGTRTEVSGSASPTDLAYAIYTSGSTGRPKGVLIEHHAVAAVLEAFAQRLGLGADCSLVAVTTTTFDIAALEIFLPLAVGGTVTIATPAQARDPRLLAELLDRADATVLQATPTTWRLLCEIGWSGRPGLIGLCGGEQMPADLIAPLLERDVRLWNVYGPTETTIWATMERITDAVPRPPIGRPIPGWYAYVLDGDRQPLPVGVPGDLWIGGIGVARGYLGAAADASANRFQPDPFAPGGGRMYRTGDRARFRDNGSLDYLGREDDQLKIRGFRIEPAEIEAALAKHPAVLAAVVAAPETSTGQRRLVAYVRTELAAAQVASLAEHARSLLPSYMVPVDWVKVDSFPLTGNGKIDRRALTVPEAPATRNVTAIPQTDLERDIAEEFRRVLRLPEIGRDEDFFQLGGHSLLAIEVCSRLSESTSLDISPFVLFENPTVAGLAALLAGSGSFGSVATIDPAPAGAPIQPSFAQQGLAFLNMLTETDPDAYFNQRAAFRIRGEFDKGRFDRALTELIARHDVLRTTIHGEPISEMRVHPAMLYAADFVDLTTTAESERETAAVRAATVASEAPFDLTTTPLLHALVVRIGPDDHAVMLSLSHFAADWESLGIALREIAEVYENGAGTLPLPSIQYRDYAHWQRGLSTTELPRQFQYWTDQLTGVVPMRLPESKPWTGQWTPVGRAIRFRVPDRLRAGLLALGIQRRATLFMTLLSVFDVLLFQRTDCHRPVVAAFAQNRLRPQTRPLLGLFPNLYPLAPNLAATTPFTDVVDQIGTATLRAAHNADLPFHMMLAIEPMSKALDRAVNNSILFYVIEGRPWHFELPGLVVEPWAEEIQSTEYPPAVGGRPGEVNIGPVDLDLTFVVDDSGLNGNLAFSSSVFDESDMARLIDDYLILAEAVVQDPDCRVADLCRLLDRSEADR